VGGEEVKTITVTVTVDIPDEATDKDIQDFVDVEYGECNSMSMSNPCRKSADVVDATWRHDV